MANIVIAWEFGRGLGHVANFGELASTLLSQGHEVSLISNDLITPLKYIPSLSAIYAAPFMPPAPSSSTQYTYSELLLCLGYASVEPLTVALRAWRDLFRLIEPDVLIADYAPTALLAAFDFKFKKVAIGIGFCCPPVQSPMPIFRTWDVQAGYSSTDYDRQLLDQVNIARAQLALAPVLALADWFRVDKSFICSFPEFDHYPQRDANDVQTEFLGPALMLDSGIQPEWPTQHSQVKMPKVFAYLKTEKMDWQFLVRELRTSAVNALAACRAFSQTSRAQHLQI